MSKIHVYKSCKSKGSISGRPSEPLWFDKEIHNHTFDKFAHLNNELGIRLHAIGE